MKRGGISITTRRRMGCLCSSVFLVLMRELGGGFNHGARLLILALPEGKGVSSSAALEVVR